MMHEIISCLCGVPGCTVGRHWQTFQHSPQAFWYAGEEVHEAQNSTFRRAIHEAGHCVVARAVGARIEAADIEHYDARSGAAWVRFPEAMKASTTRYALAEALVCLGGCAAELAILGACDLARHDATDVKRCKEALGRCEGQWNADLHEMLLDVVRDFLKGHAQAICHVARGLAQYQRFKGSDVQSMLNAMDLRERRDSMVSPSPPLPAGYPGGLAQRGRTGPG
jgi:hypothetical protein